MTQETHTSFTHGCIDIDPDHWQLRLHGESVFLTRHEFLIMWELVRHGSAVRTKSQLLDCLYPTSWGGEHAIDTHVYRIRRKITPCLSTRIETVRGIGFRLALAEGKSCAKPHIVRLQYDHDLIFTATDSTAQSFLGYSTVDLHGTDPTDLLTIGVIDRELLRLVLLAQVKRGETHFRGTVLLRSAAGSDAVCDVDMTLLSQGDGTFDGVEIAVAPSWTRSAGQPVPKSA